jgi:DNA-binding FadR family transcriptional regulator
MELLKKIEHRKLYEDVANQIEEAIVSGELKPKDKLPPERDLEKMLSVSRGTIRQSLRLLEQKGILEIKTGAHGGAFVKEVTSELITKSISLLIKFNYVTPDHIADFREHIEGQIIAKLAVENAQQEDVLNLKFMLDRLLDLSRQEEMDWSAFDSQEYEMHVVLGRMTGNPLFEALSATIMQSVHHFPQYIGRTKNVMNQVISEWTEIIKCLKDKDSKAANRLISDHILKWNNSYKMGIKKQIKEASSK